MKQTSLFILLFTLGLILAISSSAQVVRPYGIVYSDNVKGDFQIIGNTVMAVYSIDGSGDTVYNAVMNSTSANNNDQTMQWLNLDPGHGLNTYNSSAATLSVPPGSTITFARLYWGGRVSLSTFNLKLALNQQVRIKKDNGAYYTFQADGIDSLSSTNESDTAMAYQMFTDITSYLNTVGSNGVFTVGNIPCAQGHPGGNSNGAYGGWSIEVAYSNPDSSYKAIRIYDGFQYVSNTVTSTILSGLSTPSGGVVAHMGIAAWEGDAGFTGDYLQINGSTYSDALNPSNNFFNSTASYFGTYKSGRFPSFNDMMALDVDDIDASAYIPVNSNTVGLTFGSAGDGYYPSSFAFAIKVTDPVITLNKSVADSSGNNMAAAFEALTYTLSGSNIAATGSSYSTYVTDTLPSSVTYIPGSIQLTLNSSTTGITDVSGDDVGQFDPATKSIRVNLGLAASPVAGGELKPGDTYSITFKARVNFPGVGNPVPIIVNTARIHGLSATDSLYVDDGTATILPDNPQGGPLAVTLLYFNANLAGSNLVVVNWATITELNNRYFDVERSVDGKNFVTIATVQGAKSSSGKISYSKEDNISNVSATVLYYRLKQVDVNGNIIYSPTAIIRKGLTGGSLSLYPNPFINKLNINLQLTKNGAVTLRLMNIHGQLIASKTVTGIRGDNAITFSLPSTLGRGTYLLQATTPLATYVQKIIKQ